MAFLASLAGGRTGARAGHRHRSDRAAAGGHRRARRRRRPVTADGRPAARQARRLGRSPSRSATSATSTLDDRYRLVYVVFNSFSNVLTQDDQVRAFENVARHLTDDGVFVMEMGLPSVLIGLRNDQYVEAEAIGVDEVRLDLLRVRPVDADPRGEPRHDLGDRHPLQPGGAALRVARRARPHGQDRGPPPPRPLRAAGRGSPSPGRASCTSPSGAADRAAGCIGHVRVPATSCPWHAYCPGVTIWSPR